MKLLQSNTNVYIILLFTCFLCVTYGGTFPTVSGNIVMKPYLQCLGLDSITVMAETTTTDTVWVDYGSEANLLLRASTTFIEKTLPRRGFTCVHRIVLKGLQPDTKYYYRVCQKDDTTDVFSFRTGTLQPPFRFAALGDAASNPEMFNKIAGLVQKQNPLFVIFTGDLCYTPNYYSWKHEFFVEGLQSLGSSVPFYNSPGNHEGWSKNAVSFLQPPVGQGNNRGYYSFVMGNIIFLVLNSNLSISQGSPQYQFASKTLAETDKKWKVAVFHLSAYCGGTYGNDSGFRELTSEVLEPNKVNVVLNGHSHFYQRNFVNGIYHLILGGAGSGFHSPNPGVFTQLTAVSNHFAIFDVDNDVMKLRVIDDKERIIDTLTIR